MIDNDKRSFGKWWIWILALFVLSVAVLAVTGFGARFLSVTGDRVIFENSYQKSAADRAKRQAIESQLAEIQSRLQSPQLTQEQRNDLNAQASGMRVQLQQMDQ